MARTQYCREHAHNIRISWSPKEAREKEWKRRTIHLQPRLGSMNDPMSEPSGGPSIGVKPSTREHRYGQRVKERHLDRAEKEGDVQSESARPRSEIGNRSATVATPTPPGPASLIQQAQISLTSQDTEWTDLSRRKFPRRSARSRSPGSCKARSMSGQTRLFSTAWTPDAELTLAPVHIRLG